MIIKNTFGGKLLPRFKQKFSIKGEEGKQYDEAAIKLVFGLKDYPYWPMYVGTQLDGFPNGSYNFDGSPGKARSRNDLPKTYANWVTERLRLQKDVVLKGIEEIFPESYIPTAPREESPSRRKFSVLKASELTKK